MSKNRPKSQLKFFGDSKPIFFQLLSRVVKIEVSMNPAQIIKNGGGVTLKGFKG